MSNSSPFLPPAPPGEPPREAGARVRRPAVRERARLAGGGARERQSARAFSLSVALHVVVGVVVLQLLTFGHGLYNFLDPFGASDPVEERLTYVEPKAAGPKPAAPVAQAKPAVARPLSSPASAPVVGVPAPAPPVAAASVDTGGGAGRGTGGGIGAVDPNLRGAKPGFSDGRVWAGGGPVAPGRGRTGTERLDSVIASVLTLAADSLDSIARANGAYGRTPGDWTKTDKDGRKWGWDNAGIRLGKVTIPNALLSLLPLNAQVGLSGNPTEMDRGRRLAAARADIQRFATMGPADAQFSKLKDELRQRRERERRDRLKAPTAVITNAPKTDDKQR
ncbi:MAG: hypothetical protein ABIW79_10035 [Gemmatimonas sp.]